jgi:hypothetical protein
MKPVRPKSALARKLAKRPEKTLNVPIADHQTVRFGGDAKLASPGARVNVNVGAIDRGSSAPRPGDKKGSRPTMIKSGGAMITKTQGDVTRGDRNIGGAGVKLSKGQQDRLAARDAGILKGRDKKLKAKGAPRPLVQPKQAQVQDANNAKLLNGTEMSAQTKIDNYVKMHGKQPPAKQVEKLKKAEERKVTINDGIAARQAAKPKFERTVTPGGERAARQAAALKPAGKKETMRDYVDKTAAPAPALKQSELDNAQKLAEKMGFLKPAGGDQKTVVGNAPAAKEMTHDEAFAQQKRAMAALDAAKAARIARGGKSTSAEEKRLKKEFETARDLRVSIALKNANSQSASAPKLTDAQKAVNDAQFNRPQSQRVINPTGRSSSGRSRNKLGDALTGFMESKGISAEDLRPGGGPTGTLTPPTGKDLDLKLAQMYWEGLAHLKPGTPAYKEMWAKYEYHHKRS